MESKVYVVTRVEHNLSLMESGGVELTLAYMSREAAAGVLQGLYGLPNKDGVYTKKYTVGDDPDCCDEIMVEYRIEECRLLE